MTTAAAAAAADWCDCLYCGGGGGGVLLLLLLLLLLLGVTPAAVRHCCHYYYCCCCCCCHCSGVRVFMVKAWICFNSSCNTPFTNLQTQQHRHNTTNTTHLHGLTCVLQHLTHTHLSSLTPGMHWDERNGGGNAWMKGGRRGEGRRESGREEQLPVFFHPYQ